MLVNLRNAFIVFGVGDLGKVKAFYDAVLNSFASDRIKRILAHGQTSMKVVITKSGRFMVHLEVIVHVNLMNSRVRNYKHSTARSSGSRFNFHLAVEVSINLG